MSTLFRHRNRQSAHEKYTSAGARASGLSRAGGRGLIARSRDVDGAAGFDRQIAAARRGTLLQHQLQQSDETHDLSQARGWQDVAHAEDIQPHRVKGLMLGNQGAEQQMAQSEDLHPAAMKRASLINQGAETSNENAKRSGLMLQNQLDDEAARKPARGSLIRTERIVAADKERLAGASKVELQPNGNYLVELPDGTSETMSRERVLNTGYNVETPEQRAAMQATTVKSQQAEATNRAQVDGYARQIADAVGQGGKLTDVMGQLEIPPEMYGEVRTAALSAMAERSDQITNKDTKGAARWYKPWFMESDKATIMDAKRKAYNAGLHGMGTNSTRVQAQRQSQAETLRTIDGIKAAPYSPASQEIIKWANDNRGTNAEAQAILDQLARLGIASR
jgi:hypothetical protein